MNINDLLQEDTNVTPDQLAGIKATIAQRIRQLPDDDATAKALKEIEDLLQHVHAGGRKAMIYKELSEIQDPAVLEAQKMLAQFILSISMDYTPENRKEFFSLWKADEIVRIDALLSKKQQNFSQIFNGYKTNLMLKDFIDEVMNIDALGHGKGEFGLNVLSKSIWKPEDNKGDLEMKTGNGVKKIECKTTLGGAARFGDQEVRPAEGYEQAAIDLNNFVKKHSTIQMSGSGLNLNQAITVYSSLPGAQQPAFQKLLKTVITLIFGGLKGGKPEPLANLKRNVSLLLDSIVSGSAGTAAQAWSQASFNYYMSKKEDDGILYMDLRRKTCVFYNDAGDLRKLGLRFHASTPYLSATKDPGRSAYPQIEVVKTTFGADAAAKTVPKKTRNTDEETFQELALSWAKKLAGQRGVRDQRTIKAMANMLKGFADQKLPKNQYVPELEKRFPQLKVNIASQEPEDEKQEFTPGIRNQNSTPGTGKEMMGQNPAV